MRDCTISFVILHYNTIVDTRECIQSIKDNVDAAYRHIIVVDNNSPNQSGKDLFSQYYDDGEVYIILLKENLGFARGNNVGFIYAKNVYKSDFIVLMNNDTKILQNNFLQLVEIEYKKSGCAVIGPKVITPHPPFDSNPGPTRLPTRQYIFKQQLKIYLYYLLNFVNLDAWIHNKFGSQVAQKKNGILKKDIDARVENVQLHGCFWIFTPEYIRKFDGLNDKTFLYYEEQLLFARILAHNMKTVYLPSITIFHLEDSATNSVKYGSDKKKRRVLYKRLLESRWVLYNELYRHINC